MTETDPTTTDVEPKGRLRTTGETLAGFARRVPFSIAFAAVLLVTSIVTGTVIGTATDATTQAWAAGVLTTIVVRRRCQSSQHSGELLCLRSCTPP